MGARKPEEVLRGGGTNLIKPQCELPTGMGGWVGCQASKWQLGGAASLIKRDREANLAAGNEKTDDNF